MWVPPSKIITTRFCSGSWMISIGNGVVISRGPAGGMQ
jgi:hypothetical protein